MNVPVRPAPAPPSRPPAQNWSENFFEWNDGPNEDFLFNKSTSSNTKANAVKKKPPPRPPPPKVKGKTRQNRPLARSTDLLGFWSRQSISFVKHKSSEKEQVNFIGQNNVNNRVCSPSPTNRSSSDGLSVNSCGSDSSLTNNTTNASVFESGFEDDFDLFGSSSDRNGQNDSFSLIDDLDPFYPGTNQLTHSSTFPVQKTSGNSSWFEELGKVLDPTPLCPQLNSRPQSTFSSFPTIIRAKPSRPPAPSKKVLQEFKSRQVDLLSSKIDNEETSDFDDLSDWEPPMPTVPPPPPPPEAFQEFGFDLDEVKSPNLEMEPLELNKPYAIALFDYETEHADDLSFKVNDVVYLIKQINSDWLYGESNRKQGMFPSNFVNIIKPLRNAESAVKALYSFAAETSEDLSFPEGAMINITGRVNSDWLIGEYQGRKGQFPASFVDHIPSGLQSH